MRLLIVVATVKEAEALGCTKAHVVVSGIGRTNAAAATTAALLEQGPFDGALSVGIAGALPDAMLQAGDVVVATECVYMEEGLATPDGFVDMQGMGFPLGDFDGNRVPTEPALAKFLPGPLHRGVIATVATCSGTDALAVEVERRTGAIAEAMEGAAVVHAARRLGLPGGEVRVISNSTGDRAKQQWDIARAFAAMHTLGARFDQLLQG
ncbi:MAG: futalosine hydrolase [Planctomycetaceae bacterium]|nr:futalosine hydrolase [Planctomycetaceae bacterium]